MGSTCPVPIGTFNLTDGGPGGFALPSRGPIYHSVKSHTIVPATRMVSGEEEDHGRKRSENPGSGRICAQQADSPGF